MSGLRGVLAQARTLDPLSVQGSYYVTTGVWPILHLGSFMRVTGPKRDRWLVQTFGALVCAVGVSLLAGRGDRGSRTLGATSALTLAVAEMLFVARGRISPIYLGDAAVELALVAATERRRRSSKGRLRLSHG
jgi:hypothetical protein